MKPPHKTFAFSSLISLLCILPFILMEIVNRQDFNEDFPFILFFALWLNLFAILLILLPIVWSWRKRNHAAINPIPTQGNLPPTNPRSTAILSLGLFLVPLILQGLDSLGWLPLGKLLNGPDPEEFYLPGWVINLVLFSFPVAAGVIASQQIVRTLRAGGKLFAHPIHWIIVIVISTLFAIGLANLIIDQWPCFIGVPVCD